jgi:hypothetical protein
MSTKSMPLIGKSGKCRRAPRSLIFALESWEERVVEEEGWVNCPWAWSTWEEVDGVCSVAGLEESDIVKREEEEEEEEEEEGGGKKGKKHDGNRGRSEVPQDKC